jgi:cytochrome c biogenesis protein CcmG/thiol:disulfide interchange protein DsbE
MRRYVVPAVVATVAVIFVIVLAVAISDQGSNNSIAYSVASHRYKPPPKDHAKLPMLNHARSTRSFASYRGKVVLVNFFASWCPPCQAEAPLLARAQKMLSAHGGTVLGVVFQDRPDKALGYLSTYHLSYPVLTDPAGSVATAFGVTGVPDSYLINPRGQIVWLNLEQLTPAFVQSTLPKLIAQFA